jgi:MFS family permease
VGEGSGTDLRRARFATASIFFIDGALFANWAPRLPTIKDHVHASTGTLGVALLCLSIAALGGKQLSGRLVDRFGSRSITRLGITLNCLCLPLPALARSVAVLIGAFALLGIAAGIVDVAMNAHAVAVQRAIGRSVMSSFHGLYSVGGIVGAITGGVAAALGISLTAHLAAVAAVFTVVALATSGGLLSAGADTRPPRRDEGPRALRTQYLCLTILGTIGFCSLLGEGAAADWSAIHLRDDLGTSAGFAASGYAAYAIAMAVGRLGGDRFITRVGRLRSVAWSSTVAGSGFALGLVADNALANVVGYAVLGAGLSIIVPVVFTIAGGERRGSAGITVVSSMSGMGFLAGPPAIGFLAEGIGLPRALGLVSVLAFTISALSLVLERRGTCGRELVEVPAEAGAA